MAQLVHCSLATAVHFCKHGPCSELAAPWLSPLFHSSLRTSDEPTHQRSDCSFSLEHRQKQQCNRAASERFLFTGRAWHLSPGIAWLVFQIHSHFLNLGLSLIGTACPECLSSTCPLRFFRELPDTGRESPFLLSWTSFPAHQGEALILFSVCRLPSKRLKQTDF